MNIQVINFKTGRVEQVSDGYARNYLFPRKLAKLATPQDIAQATQHQQALKHQQSQQQQVWEKFAKRLPSLTIDLSAMTSPNGTLYERVSLSDILSALHQQFQISLEPNWVKIEPIKLVGVHNVQVKFPNSLTSIFHVKVTAK